MRFIDDSAVINGIRGFEVLLRDTGGVTPEQTVFSNARIRAEFGHGANGRDALSRYPPEALELRCVRALDG